jgi:hypothetical protein
MRFGGRRQASRGAERLGRASKKQTRLLRAPALTQRAAMNL